MNGIIAQLREKITAYLEVHFRLLKLSIIERTAKLMGTVIFYMILMFIFFCIIFFLGFGLKEAFVDMGMSDSTAFFLTSGIYLLLFLLVVALRKKISLFFAGEVVKVMTEGDDDSKED